MALSWSFFPFPFYGCTIIGWLTHGLEISGCFLSLSIIKRLYDHLYLHINVCACKVHVCVVYVHDHVDVRVEPKVGINCFSFIFF